MPLFKTEVLLHWAGVLLYAAACLAYAVNLCFGRERAQRWGFGLALAGLLPHGAGLLLRWAESGHGPYMARYEVLSSNAKMMNLLYKSGYSFQRQFDSGTISIVMGFDKQTRPAEEA